MQRSEKIQVFAINLPNNPKRITEIQHQFKYREEFDLNIIRGVKSKNGYIGFIKSVKKIIKQVISLDYDFVIICSDDHLFTEHYNREKFLECIHDAGNAGAKILLGGLEQYGEVIPLTDNLLWVDHFIDSTFYVIYRSFYQEIIESSFIDGDANNKIISSSTSNKFLVYPFITSEGISEKKKRGLRDFPREFSKNFQLESIKRLENIFYLKRFEATKGLINGND
ncbi:hypothetical protein [Pedobacter sp. SG908]|uniref:hypothetical protein n=1 Tax=Pedobacter sp. SG908 TaxID=2587135 RepID=UPI0014210378|nr:hypothetical protein [Pedobacter sp. SG908]NII83146.1 glycosyl transferase family 25 [Pedobacter sp. SG908]